MCKCFDGCVSLKESEISKGRPVEQKKLTEQAWKCGKIKTVLQKYRQLRNRK